MTSRAGWAEVGITPPLGLPMGGRGPRFAPGTEVLDPLMLQALILEDSAGNRQLWVSLDLIGMDHGRAAVLRQTLAATTGAPYEAVVLNFAHVHSGPMTDFHKYPPMIQEPSLLAQYHQALARSVQRAAEQALVRMHAVSVTAHTGSSDVGINRRRRLPTGEMALAPNPDGFYNPDLWVLELQVDYGDERAIVFSYGCHPVIVYGFAWDGISADFPGAARAALRDQLGANVHCQSLQGLAGNVRPRVLADRDQGVFRKSRPEDVIQAGSELAHDVVEALQTPGEKLALSLRAAAGWMHPRFDADRVMPLSYWSEMAARDDELSRNVGGYWGRRIGSGRPLPTMLPMEIGLLQLSEGHRIAFFNAEACAEWLPALRDWLDDPALTVLGYCQDVGTYLPTDALLPEGGYEAINASWYHQLGPAPFAAGIDDTVRRGFRALASRL